MKKSILAVLATVAVLGSTAVYAQHRFHHPRMSAEDRAAFVDARIAAVKAGLQLTPDQEKLWPPVETAVRDFAKQRIAQSDARVSERDLRRAERDQRRGGPDAAQGAPGNERDPVARLQERAANMAATAAGLKRIADAADPLYKSLDDNQKRRLSILTHMGGPRGWRERGFGPRGDFGPGRDNGPERGHEPDGPQRL